MEYFDLVMPQIALAQGIGRIGCFLAGCCYGKETDSRLSLVFHESEYAPNGVRLIPTQLYSAAFDIGLFAALLLIDRKKKADGQVAGAYLVLYSVGRFLIEFFRGDLERGTIGVLSTSQFIAIFLFLAGILVFLLPGRKQAKQSN
jgi:phosphatidylglycerol:prolipoprotein diacylglycerol transferase